MTKKHFELIADALRNTRPDEDELKQVNAWEVVHQWERDLFAIAAALATTNPRFDRERFIFAVKKGN